MRILLLVLLLSFSGIVRAQNSSEERVITSINCGSNQRDHFLVKGESYTFENSDISDRELSCIFGNEIIYGFSNLEIDKKYRLKMSFYSDEAREMSLSADGNEIVKIVLEKDKSKHIEIELPSKAYAYGDMILKFTKNRGANSVISSIEIISDSSKELSPLTEEQKRELGNREIFEIKGSTDPEEFMPTYRPKPSAVNGVYSPILSLNGSWKFNSSPSDDFLKKGSSVSEDNWSAIVVPGEWAMQGFEVDSAAFGGYRREFNIPLDWSGKSVIIRFDGVASESKIWINGKLIGGHLGGLTPFEFDITEHVVAGERATVSLAVRSESLADMLGSLTQYAAHQLGGITRKVTLLAVPKLHVSDLRIATDLDDNYIDAELNSEIAVVNSGKTSIKGATARVSLIKTGDIIEVAIPELASGEVWRDSVSLNIQNPDKWTSETPTLYDMAVDIVKDGTVLEHIEKRVGFREVEISGSEMLVNGVSVKLRGVNRHEVHPLKGRSLSMEEWERDIDLYLEGNCNFIRTSHYPPAEEFIQLCDEKGVFVELEAPVCWVGHHANKSWQVLNYRDSIYFPYMLQANLETIHFYRNHPSIIFWSMANESYWNYNFAKLQKFVEKADVTRPQAFHDQGYGGFNNQGSTAAVSNIHYPGPNGYKMAEKISKPLVYGEYCHLNVYNRRELVTDPGVRNAWGAVLKPTWDNMYKTDGILGGSIWSGIDDIFQMPNGDAKGYGAWGPIDGWRRAKPEFWHMKKIFSPVKVECTNISESGVYSLNIENRYSYLNMNQITLEWNYGDAEGVQIVDIEPGDSGRATVEVPNWVEGDRLMVSFRDPKGATVDRYAFAPDVDTKSLWSETSSSDKRRIKRGGDITNIAFGALEVAVDMESKSIISITKDGEIKLNGAPELMVLPLDGGACEPDFNAYIEPFNSLCENWIGSSVEIREGDDRIDIDIKGSYDSFRGGYTLTLYSGDRVEVSYSYVAEDGVNPRQWGVVFDAPTSYDNLFWSRRGLWTLYPEDHIGRVIGEAELFNSSVPESISPRDRPTWSWSLDRTALGSNDFRSTRENIYYAGLKSDSGSKITAISDGKQHWRSWYTGESIKFLIAEFNTAGNELFLGSYLSATRVPLVEGDEIKGVVRIVID